MFLACRARGHSGPVRRAARQVAKRCCGVRWGHGNPPGIAAMMTKAEGAATGAALFLVASACWPQPPALAWLVHCGSRRRRRGVLGCGRHHLVAQSPAGVPNCVSLRSSRWQQVRVCVDRPCADPPWTRTEQAAGTWQRGAVHGKSPPGVARMALRLTGRKRGGTERRGEGDDVSRRVSLQREIEQRATLEAVSRRAWLVKGLVKGLEACPARFHVAATARAFQSLRPSVCTFPFGPGATSRPPPPVPPRPRHNLPRQCSRTASPACRPG